MSCCHPTPPIAQDYICKLEGRAIKTEWEYVIREAVGTKSRCRCSARIQATFQAAGSCHCRTDQCVCLPPPRAARRHEHEQQIEAKSWWAV